ncbi:hypothetical protein H257_02097 [Aphanomyces astaci]|uniref:Uncharacterized protein n=1 Tax=Aphanomyces astaci TaxID=112090 RepID=W4H740_APHAT|nr:hypothetical protein H257_02097 [Aphanomyces astaci]ETV87099.1 hypothetical protein H257_02097 [Aphanomyces astaci]|eukprot:XP_009823898.1 hypothetical protein H257_02097 [Aphanomyces astaci]
MRKSSSVLTRHIARDVKSRAMKPKKRKTRKNNAKCVHGVTTANEAVAKGGTDAIDQATAMSHETIIQATARNRAKETVVVRTNDVMKTAVPVMDRPTANPSSKWDLRCDVAEAPLHPMEEFCATAKGNEMLGGDIHPGAAARRKTV